MLNAGAIGSDLALDVQQAQQAARQAELVTRALQSALRLRDSSASALTNANYAVAYSDALKGLRELESVQVSNQNETNFAAYESMLVCNHSDADLTSMLYNAS